MCFVLAKHTFLIFFFFPCLQGLAFLPKTECNVRDVEVAVGLMLTKTTVEPVAFRVPRVKVSQPRYPEDTWEEYHTPSLLNIIPKK